MHLEFFYAPHEEEKNTFDQTARKNDCLDENRLVIACRKLIKRGASPQLAAQISNLHLTSKFIIFT